MSFKDGTVLYVRIDCKNVKKEPLYQDALDSMDYLRKIAKGRFLLAGMFGAMARQGCINSAMVVFEPKI